MQIESHFRFLFCYRRLLRSWRVGRHFTEHFQKQHLQRTDEHLLAGHVACFWRTLVRYTGRSPLVMLTILVISSSERSKRTITNRMNTHIGKTRIHVTVSQHADLHFGDHLPWYVLTIKLHRNIQILVVVIIIIVIM